MIIPEIVQSKVREIVDGISTAKYDVALSKCAKSRLTVDDIKSVINGYARTPTLSPENAAEFQDAVAVDGAALPTWSIRTPLWTREEGRSDLTLELTISLDGEAVAVYLDDLGVL